MTAIDESFLRLSEVSRSLLFQATCYEAKLAISRLTHLEENGCVISN